MRRARLEPQPHASTENKKTCCLLCHFLHRGDFTSLVLIQAIALKNFYQRNPVIVLKSYVLILCTLIKKKPKNRLSPISSPDLAFCGQICLFLFKNAFSQ